MKIVIDISEKLYDECVNPKHVTDRYRYEQRQMLMDAVKNSTPYNDRLAEDLISGQAVLDFENIRQGKVEIPAIKNPSDSIEKEKKVNIKFESPIHDERGDDDEYEYFQ